MKALITAIILVSIGHSICSNPTVTSSPNTIRTGSSATHGDHVNRNNDILDEPIQLVYPSADHHHLVVNEDNLRALNDISDPIAVVAVVGNFHSGKSFMLNQLMGKKRGFGVGPSVAPKTMGLWMWGKPARMRDKSGRELNVVFLDTEGFAANNISENYDAKIFAVSTLLSSHLLFNSVKIINQADVDYLEILARKTQLFALKSQMSNSQWTSQFDENLLKFPPLTWVVQDFVQDQEFNESPTQWVHRLMSGGTREQGDYKISILNIFKSVQCHTLFIPAFDKELLRDLSSAMEMDLTKEYRKERDELRQKIQETLTPKTKGFNFMNGQELGHLLRILVSAANDGKLTAVPSRWDSFITHLQSKAIDDCSAFYSDEFDHFIATQTMDVAKRSTLNSFHTELSSKSASLMRHLLQGLDQTLPTALDQLSSQVDLKFRSILDMNGKRVKVKLQQVRSQSHLDLEHQLSQIKMPSSTKTYDQEVAQIIQQSMVNVTSIVNLFLEEDEMAQFITTCSQEMSRIGSQFHGKNQDSITTFLMTKVAEASVVFENFVKKRVKSKEPTDPKVLKDIFSAAKAEAMAIYSKETDDFRGESSYKVTDTKLMDILMSITSRMEDENMEVAATFLAQEKDRMSSSFAAISTKIPIPIHMKDLEVKLTAEVTKVLQEFDVNYVSFMVYPSYRHVLGQLQDEMQIICAARKKENLNAFTREVKEPLLQAKNVILLSHESYSTPYTFKKYFLDVSLIQLNHGRASEWPDDLKLDIAQHFMRNDDQLWGLYLQKDTFFNRLIGFFQWILFFVGFK